MTSTESSTPVEQLLRCLLTGSRTIEQLETDLPVSRGDLMKAIFAAQNYSLIILKERFFRPPLVQISEAGRKLCDET